MNSVEIRVPAHLAAKLVSAVRQPSWRETMVFALASHAKTSSRDLVLIREIIFPPESAFLPSKGHGARWKGAYCIELLNRANEKDLGVFWFHAHGTDPRVCMSSDDIESAAALLPLFQRCAPERPHGSIVLGEGSVAGLVALPHQHELATTIRLRLFAERGFVTWPVAAGTAEQRLLLKRQPLTNGHCLRAILKGNRVAVVGLSGGGSQVVPHLAAFGIGEILGIDYQNVDRGNTFASPNMGAIDALFSVSKTNAAWARSLACNPSVRFRRVDGRLPEKAVVDALKDADVIVGCVNNLHARADLVNISLRYCIPYVDIGLVLATSETHVAGPEELSAIAGNLFSGVPGQPCLWCAGFISESKLAAETGNRGRSYLQDGTENDAIVSSLNATLASEAATEVLRLLLGIGADREVRRQFDGLTGTLLQMSVARDTNCRKCNDILVAGDPIWKEIAELAT